MMATADRRKSTPPMRVVSDDATQKEKNICPRVMQTLTDTDAIDTNQALAQMIAAAPPAERLPMLHGDALASLTTCSTNLNPSCDFHNNQKYVQYVREWMQPAPLHCRLRRKTGGEPSRGTAKPLDLTDVVDRKRVGLAMDPICRRMTKS